MSVLIRLVEDFRERSFVDETRLYLTGNSMGGYGTWQLSCLRASWFASVMPICGGGIPGMANEFGDLPIRTFHGLCDETVDPIESLQMAKAVNKFGGYAELILFPKLSHNCWDAVYTDESNFRWMFSFTNERGQSEEK
jgi:predicted peptidase